MLSSRTNRFVVVFAYATLIDNDQPVTKILYSVMMDHMHLDTSSALMRELTVVKRALELRNLRAV